MGTLEAFYARLILIAPPLFVGTVISALALIMKQLETLVALQAPPLSVKIGDALAATENQDAAQVSETPVEPTASWRMPSDLPSAAAESQQPEENVDFDSFFATKLRENIEAEERESEEEQPTSVESVAIEDVRRAPTVDEYFEQEKAGEMAEEPSSPLAREGTFAGRSYRMYEDGSLEIDTEQSTIRFNSLDEFRAFVSAAAKE